MCAPWIAHYSPPNVYLNYICMFRKVADLLSKWYVDAAVKKNCCPNQTRVGDTAGTPGMAMGLQNHQGWNFECGVYRREFSSVKEFQCLYPGVAVNSNCDMQASSIFQSRTFDQRPRPGMSPTAKCSWKSCITLLVTARGKTTYRAYCEPSEKPKSTYEYVEMKPGEGMNIMFVS